MLNLQIHLLWASSAQAWHKAGQIIWVSLAFSHAWMSDYICIYICLLVQCIYRYRYMNKIYTPSYACASLWIVFFQTHLDTYEFMNKKVVFRTYRFKMATRWWYGSVTNGVFTADSECAYLPCHLLLGNIFLNTFPFKAHKLGICIPGTSRPSLKEESVRLPSIATCIK